MDGRVSNFDLQNVILGRLKQTPPFSSLSLVFCAFSLFLIQMETQESQLLMTDRRQESSEPSRTPCRHRWGDVSLALLGNCGVYQETTLSGPSSGSRNKDRVWCICAQHKNTSPAVAPREWGSKGWNTRKHRSPLLNEMGRKRKEEDASEEEFLQAQNKKV